MNLVRRYRAPLILVLPAGLLFGAFVGLALFAGSNEGTRTIGWAGYLIGLGAGIGVATAAVAALGAAAAVILDARRRTGKPPAPALVPIAAGAGTSVALVALAAGLVAATLQNDWSNFSFWLVGAGIDTVLAVVAAVAVSALTARRPSSRS